MNADTTLQDSEFGHIYVKEHSRAVRFTFRAALDGSPQCGLQVTAPVHYRLSDLQRSIEENRLKLRALVKPHVYDASIGESHPANVPLIDFDFCIDTDCLCITLVRGTRGAVSLRHQPAQLSKDLQGNEQVLQKAQMQLICPPDFDFTAEGRQDWLIKVLVEGIRKHAKIQLVPRLQAYAGQYGINVREVKINSSKGHWGSCARHKQETLFSRKQYFNINLSLYTLLLPLPLQRLIMLHELTHTHHMDHSPSFHRDLDRWLGGQEAALEKQLKKYTTSLFSFVK